MASDLRNISMSFEYRLWQLMFQAGWIVSCEDMTLVADPRSDAPANSYCLPYGSGGPDPATQQGGGYPCSGTPTGSTHHAIT